MKKKAAFLIALTMLFGIGGIPAQIGPAPAVVQAKTKAVSELTLTTGITDRLTVPDNKKVKSWKSENPEIVDVDQDGFLYAVSPGTAKVFAKTAKVKYAWTVTVEEEAFSSLSHDGYTLEQVVVLSRHNIRSPLSSGDSLLGKMTPHTWFSWSSPSSQLSLRGALLETSMGQYFRKWLEKEGLFPENNHPEEGEVRFYANAKQRTIATARFFSSGLLPTAQTTIETHAEYDTMDPVFTPQITFLTDDYEEAAIQQMEDLYAGEKEALAEDFTLLSDVIDLKDSPAYQSGEVSDFNVDDEAFTLKEQAEPAMSGSLKTALSASDALVLQYYEEADPIVAGFGHKLTTQDWKDISEVKDIYGDVLFTTELVSKNVAHPLLQEIEAEMKAEGREFTFLCGHDSNIGSVLAALEAEDYALPGAIEKKTPIGVKLLFSKLRDASGQEFWSVDLVYQTVEQLRSLRILDLDNAPAVFHIDLKDLSQNADGLYRADDFEGRVSDAISDYDHIVEAYSLKEAA